MRVLFTTGTTKFVTPLYWLESLKHHKILNDLTIQCFDYNNEVPSLPVQRFIDNLNYEEFDLVISHAGAGTVYSVLELNIPLFVIPDMNRYDKHQTEICQFLSENTFAEVIESQEELEDRLNRLSEGKLEMKTYYNSIPFNFDKLISLISE